MDGVNVGKVWNRVGVEVGDTFRVGDGVLVGMVGVGVRGGTTLKVVMGVAVGVPGVLVGDKPTVGTIVIFVDVGVIVAVFWGELVDDGVIFSRLL